MAERVAPATPTTRGISVPAVALRALRHRETAAAASAFVGTVLRDFFWLQFSVKWGRRAIPIVDIDHPLDEEVPFAPEKVGAYLDFIAFWIRPLGYLGRRFGERAQRRYTVEFLRLIDRCYREAAEVYRFRMSTTRRPRHYRGRFLVIQLFDPHYLCVPSLHVMIVVLAYTFYRRAFAELGVTGAEADALDRELFGGAVEITETVLYIKQHSVNCIPAALFAMSRITPEDVPASEVASFVDRLFADAPLLAGDAPDRIRAYVRDTFGRLSDAGEGDDDWTPTVRQFLLDYEGMDV
jgi:hypothetical protein